MEDFEQKAPALAANLAALYQHQGAALEARLLRAGRVELQQTDYDNWNGGTYTYAFVVNLPIELFAQLGEQQEDIEKRMKENLNRLLRTSPNVGVGEVVLTPDASLTVPGASEAGGEPTDEDHRTWPEDHFRLFLTHVSAIKGQTQALKVALAAHGIAGFVAHSDIEPTRDWQNVVEGALRTMDALAALVTPDFISSRWCDQEVGVAVGRGRLVIPVRLGADPHGFLGRYQGVAGKGLAPVALARQLFEILAKHPRTAERLVAVVLKRFEHVSSFAAAKQLMTTLEMFGSIPLELLRTVEPAVKTNVDLREAFGVPDRFAALVRRNGG